MLQTSPSHASADRTVSSAGKQANPALLLAADDVPDFADVLAARDRLAGIVHRTPVLTSRTADTRAGASLFFKCENMQRSGSFKFRGAYNAIATLSAAQRSNGVIAYSAGNHGQGLALAGKLQGVAVTIVLPHDAPAIKRAAIEGYGATIIAFDRYKDDRDGIVRAQAEACGLTIVPPFDHRGVIAGQGTLALELIEETGPLDLLLVCTGGGGLLSGVALAAKGMLPDCRVIGVEPEAGDDVQQSFRKGEIVTIPVPRSIADGALTQSVGKRNFPIIRSLVDDVVTVSDAALIEAMRFFAERMKMLVEPTGCLGLAAVFSGAVEAKDKRVGIVISGGNVDLPTFARLVGG